MGRKFLSNKKALSSVVTTIILVGLGIAAVGLVWTFVNGLIKGQISSSEACYGKLDSVQINKKYTCYEFAGGNPATYNIRFSLSVGDVDIDKIIVGVVSNTTTKTYEITNTLQTIAGLKPVPSGTQVKLPEKNSGLSYNGTGIVGEITLLRIIPVIEGTQCEVSDSLSQIEDCALLI